MTSGLAHTVDFSDWFGGGRGQGKQAYTAVDGNYGEAEAKGVTPEEAKDKNKNKNKEKEKDKDKDKGVSMKEVELLAGLTPQLVLNYDNDCHLLHRSPLDDNRIFRPKHLYS